LSIELIASYTEFRSFSSGNWISKKATFELYSPNLSTVP